ncbi:MAG TPA: response regulator transcription factor [Saprospiraceae bacterium]|nr:response regulator transcription factor [Saprospiraceae bacterium]HND88597.1 response regulator transcription factor [Saprospiraceae bacterium]HNG90137.1 response regulator transcription factor [Saprospiraceae bacterium]
MKSYNVLIADDQPIFVEGVQSVLAHPTDERYSYHVKGVAHTGAQVSEMLRQDPMDLLVLDLSLSEPDGLAILPTVKKGFTNTRVLVMTLQDDPRLVKAAFRAGADGYVLKSSTKAELFHAIEEVLGGNTFVGKGVPLSVTANGNGEKGNTPEKAFSRKYGLTRREIEIMRHIGQAQNNKEIAQKLYISDQTVSVHRKNIMRKLRVNTTAALIKIAFENNLV